MRCMLTALVVLVSQRKLAMGLCVSLSAAGSLEAQTQEAGTQGDWSYYSGDAAATKYSPLDQIDRDNVSDLRVLWRRPAVDARYTEAFPDLVVPRNLRGTPILIDGVLYAPNGVGLVEAFDPGTGETLWVQEPTESGLRGVAGQSTRGVALWSDGSEQRLFSVRGEYLYALDVKTGEVLLPFGDEGRVNLSQGLDSPWAGRFRWTSGPLVVDGIIIIAGNNSGGDFGITKEAAPGDVRGFDARTGRLLWTFHVVPRPGEFGYETWPEDSWTYEGAIGSWAPISADMELGRVYIGLSAPNQSSYGGHRPGENLFANTLVCLDARTGERLWHFQTIHHDLWDADLLTPVLGDITVDGTQIKAVIQIGKAPYLYVFDRVTGEPVWADRRASGTSVDGAGRAGVANTADSYQACAVRPARVQPGRRHRFHARVACPSHRVAQAIRPRAGLHAPFPHHQPGDIWHREVDGHLRRSRTWRSELQRRRLRSRNGHDLRGLAHDPVCRWSFRTHTVRP